MSALVAGSALVLTPALLAVPVVRVAAEPATSPVVGQGAGEALEHEGEIFSFGITVPGAVAGTAVILVGAAAILLALVPRGRRRPPPPSAF